MVLRALRAAALFAAPKRYDYISCFHSKPSPIDPSISAHQLAHQLFVQFSKPPHLRDPDELRLLGRSLTPAAAETVLNDLRGWRAAVEFFRWAALQSGYRHNCYTYNAMASVLSRARRHDQMRSLASELLASRCAMSPGALGYLIRCLGKLGLVEEATAVFDRAVDLQCVPNSYTYNCLLEVLAKAGLVEAMEFRFKEMVVVRGWEPDKYTLTSVLQSYCNAGKLEEVGEIFNKMQGKGWVDAHVLTALVVTFCKWGKVEQVFELIERMEGLGISLGEKTFFVLVHGFAKQGRCDKALEMLRKMELSGYHGDLALYSALIEALLEEKKMDRASDLYMEMKDSGVMPDVRLLKNMLSAFCREEDLVTANRLLEEDGERFSSSRMICLYNAVLDGLIDNGDIDRAHMLLREMMESKTFLGNTEVDVKKHGICQVETAGDILFKVKRIVVPTADSFSIVVCGLCRAKQLDIALVLLNDMIEMGCRGKLLMYNNVINELSSLDRLEESYKLFGRMKELGFVPTAFTYNCIFGCLCQRQDVSAAFHLLREMRHHGHTPWIKHCTMMVQHLCRNGKVSEASSFLDGMVNIGFLPDMIAYSAVIDGMCKNEQVDEALKLFHDISSRYYLPDVIAHNILVNGLSKAGRIKEATEIVKEMREKNLVPSPVTYNTLIDGWFKAKRIDNALDYFSKMIDETKSATVVTYTSLIDGLFNAEKHDEAILLWNQMRENACVPNKMAYTALIHGLCKCGKADSALLFLHEMKDQGLELDCYVYLLLINSLILEGQACKGLDLMKEVFGKCHLPAINSKTLRLMVKAVCKLYSDESTSLGVKSLVDGGYIPVIQNLELIRED